VKLPSRVASVEFHPKDAKSLTEPLLSRQCRGFAPHQSCVIQVPHSGGIAASSTLTPHTRREAPHPSPLTLAATPRPHPSPLTLAASPRPHPSPLTLGAKRRIPQPSHSRHRRVLNPPIPHPDDAVRGCGEGIVVGHYGKGGAFPIA